MFENYQPCNPIPVFGLRRIQDWLGSLTIERDIMGRPETVTDHMGRKTEYLWDAEGVSVHYEYSLAGRRTRKRYGSGNGGKTEEKTVPWRTSGSMTALDCCQGSSTGTGKGYWNSMSIPMM